MMSKRWMGIGYGFIAALIWGGFPVVTRLGVTHSTLDAYDITFIRFLVSGMLLLPIAFHRGLGGLGFTPFILMVIGAGAPYLLVITAALSRAPVGFFVLTPGSMIAFTAVLSMFVMKMPLSITQKIGIATVLLGMGLATCAVLSETESWLAIMLFLLGGLLWAIYSITTKLYAVDPLQATMLVAVGSALVYCPVYIAVKGMALLHAPIVEIATQALYQGVLMSILGLYFFSKAVLILGPAIGATFTAWVPLFATIGAQLLLGEQTRALTLIGIVIVTIGMVISLITYKPKNGLTV